MNNYYYIIAGLPVLTPEWKPSEGNLDEIRQEIAGNCSDRDRKLIDLLERGLSGEGLDADFYRSALASENRFIREYFQFDLNVRNAKVRYLNGALGREAGKDLVVLDEETPEDFEEAGRVDAVLHGKDILERERGLDDIMWSKIDELTVFDYFDVEAVLGFLARLHIVERWLLLDETAGREMFRKLVDEVRGTFKGVQYNPENN